MSEEETMTPEQRRDQIVGLILATGACILRTDPLATSDDPHTIAAWFVEPGITGPGQADALAALRTETETALHGLIPWTPEPEVVPDEA